MTSVFFPEFGCQASLEALACRRPRSASHTTCRGCAEAEMGTPTLQGCRAAGLGRAVVAARLEGVGREVGVSLPWLAITPASIF